MVVAFGLFLEGWLWSDEAVINGYFHGMEERISRLETQPLIRDEEKQDQFLPLWDEWMIQWQERPEAVRLWDIGWMLEEWRLQLFAPGVPHVGKTSAKTD